jgi:hypothetical protein
MPALLMFAIASTNETIAILAQNRAVIQSWQHPTIDILDLKVTPVGYLSSI